MSKDDTLSVARQVLSSPLPADPLLLEVAGAHASHRFLGGGTGQIYQRQVALAASLLDRRFGKPRDQIRVLDWGCGKGHITYLFKKAGFRVTSADVALADYQADDSAFRQQTPLIQQTQIDVVPLTHQYELPFANESFDCVLSFGVLEHVPDETGSLKEIRRVLVAGGMLFITFLPRSLSWTQRLAHVRGNRYHERLYTRAKLSSMLTSAGFAMDASWEGQLFPKNSMSVPAPIEKIDRWLTNFTPLKAVSTNIEAVAIAV